MRRLPRICGLILIWLLLGGCDELLHIPALRPQRRPATAVILVDLPPGIREGAQLAVDDVMSGQFVIPLGGNAVRAVDLSDTSAGEAAQHLRRILKDPGPDPVLGLVGPADYRRAERELPIASSARLLTVSPSLVDDCLTQSVPGCPRGEPDALYPKGSAGGSRGAQFFYRWSATRSAEGRSDADYAYNNLSRRNAVVVQDDSTLAHTRAEDFARRFNDNGGKVLATLELDPSSPAAISTTAAKVSADRPDVVFLACEDAAGAGRLRAATMGQGMTYLAGQEYAAAPEYVSAAGGAAEGTLVGRLEPNAAFSAPELARRLVERYPAAAPARGYAMYAYFATIGVLQAISSATTNSVSAQSYGVLPTAQQVLAAASAGPGVDAGDRLGTVTFDPHGDNVNQVIAVDMVEKGRWVFKEQLNLVR